MKQTLIVISVSTFGFGCATDQPNMETVRVGGDNALGVVTLAVEHSDEVAATVLRVSGLDAAGNAVATYEQRVGTIPGLSDRLPGPDELGTEQIITVQGETLYGFSRAVGSASVPAMSTAPGYRAFFNLTEVKAVLGANHVDVDVPSGDVRPVTEVSQTVFGCLSGDLNTSPTVAQCCENYWGAGSEFRMNTYFKPVSGASANLVIVRYSKGIGTCKGLYGESCSGSGCYFGPNGWSMPSIWSGSSSYSISTQWSAYWDDNQYQYVEDEMCTASTSGGDGRFSGTMSGTFATGQGCPGGNSGDGLWDY